MSDGGQAEFDVAMARVWAQSQDIMRQRVTVLEEAAATGLAGEIPIEQRRAATQEAHKLAGSLGTFGLAEASRLAREVELLLQGARPVASADTLRLTELVLALGQQVDAGPAAEQPAPGPAVDRPDGAPSVLLVDADQELTYRLVEEATARRLQPIAVPTAAAARGHVAAARPDLVVLDPDNCGEADGGRAFLAELCQPTEPIPTVVLTAPGGTVDRAEAARLGSRGYLEKPVPPRMVAEVVGRILRSDQPTPTVLVVGDSSAAAAMLEAARPRRLRVEAVAGNSHFWTALQRVRPALVVLDVGALPQESLRLCRMVRGDMTWERLPVVVVGDAPDDVGKDLFRAGADDVLVPPVSAEDLAVRVTNRLERSGPKGGAADPGSGSVDWPQWQLELRRMVAIAARSQQPLAVAVLAVDDPPEPDLRAVAAAAGQTARTLLGRLLRRSLRMEDAVGEREDGLLVAALYGADPTEAVERLARTLETFRDEPGTYQGMRLDVTASAGLAVFPVDGGRAEILVDRAAAALRNAQVEGGDRIQTVTGDAPPPSENVDVLLVDDDETLGPLLIHALTTRGYRTHWLRDGADAAATLLTPDGLRPRVVLLDVGLPGLDGLSLLRELANAGSLERCRVVMLTLRSSEQEVLEALELGAFDHVAKPVSVPLLLQWVRRAMESLPS